jgi:hypothetical protein
MKKEIQEALIEKARKEHKNIKPCGTKESLEDCFTYDLDKVLFWFNVEDDTTRVLMHDNLTTENFR